MVEKDEDIIVLDLPDSVYETYGDAPNIPQSRSGIEKTKPTYSALESFGGGLKVGGTAAKFRENVSDYISAPEGVTFSDVARKNRESDEYYSELERQHPVAYGTGKLLGEAALEEAAFAAARAPLAGLGGPLGTLGNLAVGGGRFLGRVGRGALELAGRKAAPRAIERASVLAAEKALRDEAERSMIERAFRTTSRNLGEGAASSAVNPILIEGESELADPLDIAISAGSTAVLAPSLQYVTGQTSRLFSAKGADRRVRKKHELSAEEVRSLRDAYDDFIRINVKTGTKNARISFEDAVDIFMNPLSKAALNTEQGRSQVLELGRTAVRGGQGPQFATMLSPKADAQQDAVNRILSSRGEPGEAQSIMASHKAGLEELARTSLEEGQRAAREAGNITADEVRTQLEEAIAIQKRIATPGESEAAALSKARSDVDEIFKNAEAQGLRPFKNVQTGKQEWDRGDLFNLYTQLNSKDDSGKYLILNPNKGTSSAAYGALEGMLPETAVSFRHASKRYNDAAKNVQPFTIPDAAKATAAMIEQAITRQTAGMPEELVNKVKRAASIEPVREQMARTTPTGKLGPTNLTVGERELLQILGDPIAREIEAMDALNRAYNLSKGIKPQPKPSLDFGDVADVAQAEIKGPNLGAAVLFGKLFNRPGAFNIPAAEAMLKRFNMTPDELLVLLGSMKSIDLTPDIVATINYLQGRRRDERNKGDDLIVIDE